MDQAADVGLRCRETRAEIFLRHQEDRRTRLVVDALVAGNRDRVRGRCADGDAEMLLELAGPDRPRAEDLRRFGGDAEDRRLGADRARAAVQHRVDPAFQPGEHLRCGRRAELLVAVRGRRGDGQALVTQDLEQRRVIRHPQSDRRQPARHDVVDSRVAIEEQRQRARPERSCQVSYEAGDLGRPVRELLGVAYVHDQRMGPGTPLRREDVGDRVRVRRICRQSVDRLGRHGHEPARAEQAPRLRHVGRHVGAQRHRVAPDRRVHRRLLHRSIETKAAVRTSCRPRSVRPPTRGAMRRTGPRQDDRPRARGGSSRRAPHPGEREPAGLSGSRAPRRPGRPRRCPARG